MACNFDEIGLVSVRMGNEGVVLNFIKKKNLKVLKTFRVYLM